MRILRFCLQVSAACVLLGGAVVFGQTQPAFNVDRLLSQIEANTDRYSATVPSFTCDEHIVSQELRQGQPKRETSVDAVFSVV